MNLTPEIHVTKTPPKLPEKTNSKREATFLVPSILKSISKDENGFIHKDVREGGLKQIEFETETEYAEQPAEEEVFAVKATNQINFGGGIFNVINDEVLLDNGFRLVPTEPTASEYLSKVGTKVLLSFSCKIDNMFTILEKHTIYRIDRTSIVLP